MIARDLEMRRAMRWPFYFLSSLSLVAGILATVRTYEISKTTQPPVYTYDTFCATVLAILEQNFGIVAANVLPMGPLFSRRRPRINRAPSRVSGISNRSGHVGWVSSNDSTTNLKRSSALVIEGPRRASFETSASNRSHLDVDSRSLRDSWNVSDGWPRGIIKTVEVEVIEEDLADIEMAPGGRSSRISTLTVEHDWEAMLRAGPTPIPSRGPSRQD
ncbi:uncharacterized protein E0L32_007374 [Thyridium curvatum]|uniref:Uncharacterized protein n=1 Tax=Thyridium curvatum TaxID=1093900 RepID=A0A507AYM1_9PEZI|nr:uncharacterized protein E0L32_007374 [Thyridium curvatum]TPX11876.1 hypothetical protein E0L32_007374 [Thyridium curvatum]